MKRPVFLLLLLLHSTATLAADIDIANRALERGDYATAAAAFRELAERGNLGAQSHLGYMYYVGEGVPQSYEKAVQWYRKAATQGDADAQYNLAVAYAFGEGVEKDLREAATWYRRAAEQGHAVAQYSLGISHAYGEGVKQDGALAARWFLQAAEQDYEPAQVMIASIYHTGDGIPQDHTKAARWYRKAAEKGNAVAQYNLGTLYRAGKGVAKNNTVAERWFTKAARQGYTAAEKELLAMQQAVTVAPGAPATTAATSAPVTSPEPEPETGPEPEPEAEAEPAPKTTISRSNLPSGKLTSDQQRHDRATARSDEALVTIRKEDLLTLEPEPETEPLATVDEISGVEYQGAPTARPAKPGEKTEEEPATTEKPRQEKQAPAMPDNLVTRPAEPKSVPDRNTGVKERPAVSDDGEQGGGLAGFFKRIFSGESQTETAKHETTKTPVKTAPIETPYSPRPAPVTTPAPEQELAGTDSSSVDTSTDTVSEEEDWGRPRSRAPAEKSVATYADGDAPAKQQLQESREESRTAGTTQVDEPDTAVEPAAAGTTAVMAAAGETGPGKDKPDGEATPETVMDPPVEDTAVATADSGAEEESGGLGTFFKRLFGGDGEETATPSATETTSAGRSPVQAADDAATEDEPVLVARAEPGKAGVPLAEEAVAAQEEETARSGFEDLRSSAVEGDPASQYRLATMYYTGNSDSVEQDLEQAFIWYRRAAQQGNAEAQFGLAGMYLAGEGIRQNEGMARHWFEKAAEQGHPAAAESLAELQVVVAGEDAVEVTPVKTVTIENTAQAETVTEQKPLQKTASVTKEELESEGEPEATGDPGEESYNRGMAYAYGEGATRSLSMAFKYFRHAAELGYVPAQYRLGVAYANGEGTEQDYGAALKWYQKAARQGYAIAQRSLCKMYLEGLGVEQNKPMALAWYSILADTGNVMDTHRRDRLARELTEAQRQEAERLKRELTASITTASSGF